MARPVLSEAARATRRTELLAAAMGLYRNGRALPTVAEIAAVAGVAKGTVYLTFPSKEAILTGLLDQSVDDFLSGLMTLLAQLPEDRARLPAIFATAYARLLAESDVLLPLALTAFGVASTPAPGTAMVDFRDRFATRLAAAGSAAEGRLGLATGQGGRLLLQTWALTLGLWPLLAASHPDPSAGPSQATRALRERDFATELRSAVARLWRL